MNFELSAELKFSQPFHLGTGLSQPGVADRTIGLDKEGQPVLRGDAVKGAIRSSAERLVRWLLTPKQAGEELEEQDDHSLPPAGSLDRIFRGGASETAAFYRFDAAKFLGGGQLQQIASTRIDPKTGVAANQTLRILQSWTPGARFRISIRGFQGNWDQPTHADYFDLTLLVAALVCTGSLGGRKGSGHGALQLSSLQAGTLPLPLPDNAAHIEALQRFLQNEVAQHA